MNHVTKILLGATSGLILVGFMGCQTMPYQPYAREAKRKPGIGGIIALKTEHREEDHQKAEQTMASNCGGPANYKVLEEGEVVTGTQTTSSTKARDVKGTEDKPMGSLFGIPLTQSGDASGVDASSSSSTSQIKEWEINYECTKAAVATKGTKKIIR